MRRICWISVLIFELVLSWTFALAGDFYVIPTQKKNFAPVPKTGQTQCYDAAGNPIDCSGTGQDGELQKGVAWPDPRFTDNSNGTVTDNLTGLIWLKNSTDLGQKNWAEALVVCNALKHGDCGLTDGSSEGDWRLPNVNELHSLVDKSRLNPALPAGHPFLGLTGSYWSSTTISAYYYSAWGVNIHNGIEDWGNKSNLYYVRAVRGGR
ncbi:MAG TPA: DUF1566 domain-containing protein [Syntrophales bacterium]|nr:DUF1566 domain-containing protein [Syntrophales bacterium]HPQ45450.1 DUF1566 domain-containing protein [Syntrophales bacterium]